MLNECHSDTRIPPAPLQYANPRIEKPTRWIYRTVIVLGAAPMVLGGLALLTFWAMRWNWGGDFSSVLVAASVWAVFLAGAALVVFFLRERRYKRMTPGALRMRLVLAAALLVCNVPLVAVYVAAPRKLTRRMTVTVINNGQTTIDRFVVKGGGVITDIGPVAPGATVKGTFYVPMNSWLSYEAWQIRPNSRSMVGGGLDGGPDRTITVKGEIGGGMTIR